MLKPKSNREELKRIRSTLMTAAEIRSTYAAETCCSKNCMQNLINGPGRRLHNRKSSNGSSISSGSEPTRDIDSYLFCQQVGVPSDTIPFLVFDQFLEEVRKPFRQLTAGSGNQAEANDQLRYYLVQKFTENRVNDSDGGGNHNTLYIYIMMGRVGMEILLVYTYIIKYFFNIAYMRIYARININTYTQYISKFSHLVETE